MTRVLLVRHARPAAAFDAELDPGLDDTGRRQADALADDLAARAPLEVATSPLRRARETAVPLAERWRATPTVVPAFGEIPSPIREPSGRGAWIRTVLGARWAELEPQLVGWRAELLAMLRGVRADTVVFTHFVAINTVVGAATASDRVTSFSPAHTSVTEIEVAPDGLTVVSLGAATPPDGRGPHGRAEDVR
jgi:broad specificity phosphatase PhoE